MKKKLIYTIMILLLLASFYEVIFRTRTVTYLGEDENWFIKIDAKLVGLNGSYSIEVQYKGKETIQDVNFNVHPHYEVGFPVLNEKGNYYWECLDCGYYDKESKLLFFIVWKEGNKSEEKMKFIDLRKK